ncbi:MAG: hypothetical protein AABX99_04465 [Nanoarchaeota archaeon]
MKKSFLIAGIFLIILFGIFLFFRFNEDNWIKDNSGVWIKHGNPAEIPDYVLAQQSVINCSADLYMKAALSSVIQLNSQCLGTCGDYAVDIVHVPRIAEDDKTENQCESYLYGKVNHFIELDRNGSVVRIV